MTRIARIVAGAFVLVASLGTVAGTATAAERAIIILDGSGSMWAQIDGEARITIARETLDEVLDEVPDDLELGFMTYGHREKGDCADIEMLVEPAAGTAEEIREAAEEITPLGKTPISDAVRLAAEDLKYTEEKATVILITDGIESCEADPCELATELEEQGIDFTTHVVGFGLNEDEGEQVACLAENTGGQYFQASDADQLAAALTTTVNEVAVEEDEAAEEPPPTVHEFNFEPELVLAEGGDVLDAGFNAVWEFYRANADGSAGEYVDTEYGARYRGNLEPGDYVVRVRLDYARAELPVTIVADEVATPLFNLNGGRLIIHPLASEGAEPDASAAIEMRFPDNESDTSYGDSRYFVPAGTTEVTVHIGSGEASVAIDVAAGEEVERDIVLGIGHVTIGAFYVEGMPVEDDAMAVNVVGAKKDIQGNRKDFGTNYGSETQWDLPPGDYVAIVKMGEARIEAPFSVAAGEAATVAPTLEAGVLAVSAPGMDFVEVLGAKKDIQGKRTSFTYGYGGALQTTLPAGDYTVVAHNPGDTDTTEMPAQVVAGERTELTIE